MIAHWPLICFVLGVVSMLLVAGRIRHTRRRSAFARQLGGTYDSISGRIFIRKGDRLIEFTAVEKLNAYVPPPAISCSLKTTVQCDIIPKAPNPLRTLSAENMPSKEVKLGPTAYMLKADTAERLAHLESLLHNSAFSLLFSSNTATTPRLQIYPLSTVARGVKDNEESHAVLTELPMQLVSDPSIALRFIDAFNRVVDDIAR